MNNWKKIPIGELFTLEKGSLQSTKCTPGEYTFITASSDWKTHENYSHDCEALIYAVAASGSLGRCHYYKGKFITSDLCFILRAKNEKKMPINYRFYQNIFSFLKNDIVSKTKAGTSKESISQKRLSNYSLPYIDYEHQIIWEEKLNSLNKRLELFSSESVVQSTLLSKLRQALLQEAIEGKLTAGWRKSHPVKKGDPNYDSVALLATIKAEKQKMIAEGIIKKESAQESIVNHKLTIPGNWVYPLLGEITKQITDGTHQTPTYVKNGKIFLSAQNVKPFRFLPENHQFISEQAYNEIRKNRIPELGDLLIARVGAGIGETAVLDIDIKFAFYVSLGLVKIFSSATIPKYLTIVCNSPYGVRYSKGNVSSSGTSAGNYNLGRMRSFEIPLPPIAEQQAIVSQVEKLLAIVGELEKQIAERKSQAEEFMQSVLREAFEGKSEKTDNRLTEVK